LVASYQWLATQLREKILDGTIPPGSQMPSSAELQRQYHLGRGAVESAVRQLRSEGLIETRAGARPEVVSPLPAALQMVDPREPWPYRCEPVAHGTKVAHDDVAERLAVPDGTRLHWTRYECMGPDGRPAMLETVYRQGTRRREGTRTALEMRLGEFTPEEAQALGIAVGLPALRMELTRCDETGRPVAAADLVLRADRWGIRL
jgi:DNA-binding GntR family transcriptional regulator